MTTMSIREAVSTSVSDTSTTMKASKTEEWNRQALFLISCLYVFLFVGAFYGYGQLQLILEDNQAFRFLCPETDETAETESSSSNVCSAQTNALIRVQLIAQSIQMAAPLLGYGVDRFGARRSYFVMASHMLLGVLLLLVSTTLSQSVTGSVPQVDRLLYVAMIFISIGVCLAAILIVQTGIYFHGRMQRRVISILNALFDAGAITYLFLWLMYTKADVSITTVFATYFGVGLLIFIPGMYYWCVAVPEAIEVTGPDNKKEVATAVQNQPMDRMDHNVPTTVDAKEISVHRTNHTSTTIVEENHEKSSGETDEADGCIEVGWSKETVPIDPSETSTTSFTKKSYILIAHRTRMQQLTSLPAACLAIFVGVHATSNNWTMATIRDFLASLGDDDYDNRYLTLFTLLTPVSLFGLPFVDYIMHHYGFHVAFQSVNALGLGYMLIRLCSSNLNVQVVGFIIFAFFRCFLYSVFQSFVPTLFSPDVVGLCIGLLVGIPGVAAFLNVPLAKYIIEGADGDFYVANLLYTLLIIPCIVASYCIGRTIRLERRCKEGLKHRHESEVPPNGQTATDTQVDKS